MIEFGILHSVPSFDPTKAKRLRAFDHKGTFYALALDAAANRLYAGSDDYGIHVFDPAAEKKEPLASWTKHDNYVSVLVVAKPLVVSGSYDRTLIWWQDGKPIRTVEAHQGWVRDLAVTPDGKLLVSVGDDMLVKLWDAQSGQPLQTLEGHDKRTPQGHVTALYTVAVSPDGKHLASGDRIGTVCVWEVETGKLAQRFQAPTLYTYDPRQRKRSLGGIRSLAFSPDSNLLGVGGMGQVENVDGMGGLVHLEIWDWKKPQARATAGAQGHKGMINHLVFHPQGDWLIGAGGGSENGFLAFWKIDKIPDMPKKDALTVHRIKMDGHIHHFCLNSTASELYAAGFHKLEVWSLGV
jgi:WD40 repeat protein